MNKNKAKCDVLKKIRKGVADKLGIDLHQKECTFEGTCTGTCPKCKQEEEILNKAISKKVGALTMGAVMGMSLAACTPQNGLPNDYEGGMTYIEPSKEPIIDFEPLSGDIAFVDDNIDCNETQETKCEDIEEKDCDEPTGPIEIDPTIQATAGVLPYDGE